MIDLDPAAHYRRIEAALREIGTVNGGDAETLPVTGNAGWYRYRGDERRCWRFTDEFDEWSGRGDRTLYTTLNYQDPQGLATGTGDDRPTPEYGDIEAFALWTDFDLADDLKAQRPSLDDETRATFEAALTAYVDRFADLVGDVEHVKLLDSVGGAYPIVPPTTTAPIADSDAFDRDDREQIFAELCARMRAWIDETTADVCASIDGAEAVVDADPVQNVNRQFKTLGSIHKTIDGVVHPLDPTAVEYDYVPISAVSDVHIKEWTEWAADFTDDRHRGAVESIVATLWPDHYDDTSGWEAALRSWLEARERERERKEAASLAATDAGTPLDPADDVGADESEVRDALAHLNPDMGREQWIRVGLALGHEFSRSTARQLFTQWSRGGSKWDDKAADDVDDLIDRAASGGASERTATIKTLFRYAIDAGWRPSADGSGDVEGRDDVAAERAERYGPETCVPPAYDPEPFDREQRWSELEGERYDGWLDRERAHIWGDGAGTGKTTNGARAAAARDRPYAVLFDKHAKAREFIRSDVTPDGYFHLKGGEQPLFDCCMDAVIDADDGETPGCPTHGHPAEWRRMNPIYELGGDDPIRERYEVLVSVVGPRRALFMLDEEQFVEENPWLEQFERLATAERVVGVHEYQTLRTVLEGESVGERDLILDETPRLLASEHRVSVEGLVRAENRLNNLADSAAHDDANEHNFRELAYFAGRLRDVIVGDESGAIEDVDPPALISDRYESWDPTAGNYLADGEIDEDWQYAEAAAQVKLAYNEAGIRRVQDGTYNGEPFCMDPLLAAAAIAGLPSEELRRAIAVGPILEDCPWCASELGFDNGARCCTECGWHELANTVAPKDGEPARATAWLDDDPDDLDRDEEPALAFKQLPDTGDLPDPLVLDATATPEKVAGLYGHDVSAVDVEGDEPVDLTGQLRVTQVVGGRHGDSEQFHVGGQYHAQTIKDSETLRERIQATIDTAGELHDRPLFGIRKDLISLFTFPENGEVLHYGGARGLDFEQCDAVVCIGAPHPNVDDLRRDAELLAMDRDRDDLRVGGEEYSTRRNAPNPPVYRKLLHADENGDGLAVPTKAYSGLVGALFREGREKEIEQFVHRIRPVLADELKHAYLLTDVPTDIAVDDVVGLEELADPIQAILPVSEGAVRLLGHVLDVHDSGGADGFRPGELVETRADGSVANKAAGYHRLARMCGEGVTQRTVRNWIQELEALGLLTPETYEQRRGVSYTADISTSKRALQVLSSNGGFEVALKRRLASLAAEVDSGLTWLRQAADLVTFGGDRCTWPTVADGGDRASHDTV